MIGKNLWCSVFCASKSGSNRQIGPRVYSWWPVIAAVFVVGTSGLTVSFGLAGADKKPMPTKFVELRRLEDNKLWFNSVVFSPDSKILASASGNWGNSGEIKLWDAKNFQELATLVEPAADFSGLAFTRDGKTMAAGAWEDNAIVLADVATAKVKTRLGKHKGRVRSVAFSPDGKSLAAALGAPDNSIELWNVDKSEKRHRLTGHAQGIWSVAYSPDGKTLATGSNDMTVRLWNLETRKVKLILKGHLGAVTHVAFSPDGELLASASIDKTIRLWDVGEGESRKTLNGHDDQVFGVAFSPDGKTLASGGKDRTVRLWDTKTGKQLLVLSRHKGDVVSVAFAPNGKLLASAGRDKTIRLWRLPK